MMQNEWWVRSLTGVLFVGAVVGATTWSIWSHVLLWTGLAAMAGKECQTLLRAAPQLRPWTMYLAVLVVYTAVLTLPWLGGSWALVALPAHAHDGWPVVQFATLIWANDTMAFVGGKMLGRHKLAPAISPGKTWEGAIVGTLGAGLAAAMWWGPMGLGLGLLAGALSTCGDLMESRVKRLAKVKDSGALLPGHGGVLDRFDGFLFAAPVHSLLWCIFVAQT